MEKNNKVSNLYGRARRIAFLEKVIYCAVGVVALILVVLVLANRTEETDQNVNFAYLRTYLEDRGYVCEVLHRVNGQCKKAGKISDYTFIRYDDGFEYIVNSKGYILDIRHKSNDESRISFRTTNDAFAGYKNQTYSCQFKNNVLSELGECSTNAGDKLDMNSYIGVIEQSIYEVNNMIDSSGYKKDKLVNDFVWEKKE